MNESFRTSKGDGRDSLDVSAAREAYTLLLGLEPKDTFIQPLVNSLEIHLAALSSVTMNPDEVSQLVILLENPLVQESQALLQKLCQVISQLPADSRQSLIAIFMSYDVESFKQLLQVGCILQQKI